MTDPIAPLPPNPEPPVREVPPKKSDGAKPWLQALGITLGVIGGVLGLFAVGALALVGLVLWTCSQH